MITLLLWWNTEVCLCSQVLCLVTSELQEKTDDLPRSRSAAYDMKFTDLFQGHFKHVEELKHKCIYIHCISSSTSAYQCHHSTTRPCELVRSFSLQLITHTAHSNSGTIGSQDIQSLAITSTQPAVCRISCQFQVSDLSAQQLTLFTNIDSCSWVDMIEVSGVYSAYSDWLIAAGDLGL